LRVIQQLAEVAHPDGAAVVRRRLASLTSYTKWAPGLNVSVAVIV
jgi:hypothetical protein